MTGLLRQLCGWWFCCLRQGTWKKHIFNRGQAVLNVAKKILQSYFPFSKGILLPKGCYWQPIFTEVNCRRKHFSCRPYGDYTIRLVLHLNLSLFLFGKHRGASDPWRILFGLASLYYDIDVGKIDSQAGLLSAWRLHVLPMSVWVFSRYAGFHPHLKDVHVRFIRVFHSPRVSVCVCMCVPCDGRVSCRGLGSYILGCQDKVWGPVILN